MTTIAKPPSPVTADVPPTLFQLLTRSSRFWLPPFLQQVATIIPSLCKGDGCSIFLVAGTSGSEQRLHLAATTRGEMRTHLFDKRWSYTIDPDALRAAADYFRKYQEANRDAGLTGWVVAFERPLLIRNLHNAAELASKADPARHIPPPVWSDKNRGFLDQRTDIPRPYLCVPMHCGDRVIGAIRVATSRHNPQEFDEGHCRTLQEVADSLGAMLDESGVLAGDGLKHFFRIWAAEDVNELAMRITRAVPALFDVECCSFFLRDAESRFILHNAACSDPAPDHFRQFLNDNRGKLHYMADDGSKTATAIGHQRPVVLVREEYDWKVVEGPEKVTLKEASGGQYKTSEKPAVRCEFPHEETRSIILVPVRDVMSMDAPAGVLRIVSRTIISDYAPILTELLQFAEGLAGAIATTWQDELQRGARQRLVSHLSKKDDPDKKIEDAAQIVCDVIRADALTIFVRREDRLRSEPAYSVLADRYRQFNMRDIIDHHELFRSGLPYVTPGQGRTGWVAETGHVLNLRDINDPTELERIEITTSPSYICELATPGPFLAAPIAIDPRSQVQGVIRALRERNTSLGSFTVAHEEILTACGQMLATILRWSAVISYCTKSQTTMDEVASWIEGLGGLARALTDRSRPDPELDFLELLDHADIAVIIATADDEDGHTSSAVEWELAAIRSNPRLRSRHIVLMMDGARFRNDTPLQGATVIHYPRVPAGIHIRRSAFEAAVKKLRAPAPRESRE